MTCIYIIVEGQEVPHRMFPGLRDYASPDAGPDAGNAMAY